MYLMKFFRCSVSEIYLYPICNLFILGVILFIALFILAGVQILLHEVGHCLFGYLTGYHFISFRVGKLTIINENGKYIMKRYGIPGTCGQCIMQPPEYSERRTPYVLFFMGGIIMNAISFLFTTVIAICFKELHPVIRFILLLSSFLSIGYVLMDGIPFKKVRINTDGTNLYRLRKNAMALKSCHFQMDIIPLMQRGSTYRDFSKVRIILPDEADLSNEIIAWHKIIECYYYMDIGQFKKALDTITMMEEHSDNYSKLLKETIAAEKLFLFIKLNYTKEQIDDLYLKIREILLRRNVDFNFTRVRIAYDLLVNKSENQKKRILEEVNLKRKQYPYLGEAVFNYRLIREMMTE